MDPSTPPSDGTKIYDAIMVMIEPELTNAVLPTLKEKYKNETPEQAQQRKARYRQTFEKYDEVYASYQRELNAQVMNCKRTAVKTAEDSDRKTDTTNASSLLEQIATL